MDRSSPPRLRLERLEDRSNPSGFTISTVAGDGTRGSAGDGGPATAAQLNYPVSLARDAAGDLFLADYYAAKVRRVDAATGVITTYAGTGTAAFGGDGGPATAANLEGAGYLAADAAGNLFISGGAHIRRVDAATGVISTVAGNGTFGFAGDGGLATAAELDRPYGIAVDAAGDLFLAGGNRVRRVDAATGVITTVAGTGGGGSTGDGGPATAAQFGTYGGLGLDGAGDLFIADGTGNDIRRVDAATGVITTVAGTGTAGSAGDGGPATAAQLRGPSNVRADPAGNLYVADYGSQEVRRIDAATGVITTVAGTAGMGGSTGDGGPATAALLSGPDDLVLDPAGDLFVVTTGSNQVRELQVTAVTLGPPVLPAGRVGAAYSQALSAGGGIGVATYTVTAGALPAGLSLSPAGVLGGTPTAAGTFTFTVTATDPAGDLGTLAFSVAITNPLVIGPTALPGAQVEAAYTQTLTAAGGTGAVTFTVTAGALPAGLALSSAGVLGGVPTDPGTFAFTVTAADPAGDSGTQAYAIAVTVPAPPVVPVVPPVPPVVPPAVQAVPPAAAPAVPLTLTVPAPEPAPLLLPPPVADVPKASPPSPPAVGLVGAARVVVGSPDGTLQVINPDGTVAASAAPFPGYVGEVRTAAGAGDQVVAGTGPGVASEVRLFDPATGASGFDITPFETSFTGGVFVTTGYLFTDPDGGVSPAVAGRVRAAAVAAAAPDVVVTADAGGGPRVLILNGTTGAVEASFLGITDADFRGGCRTAVADLTGDGVPDLVVAAGAGGGPRVEVFDGAALRAGKFKVVADLYVFDPSSRNGVYVAGGDVNGDGKADLIAGGGPGGGPRVLILSGKDLTAGSPTPAPLANFFAGDPANRGGVRVAVKNLDGDGRADLVTAPGPAGGTLVTAYAGKTMTPTGTPPALFRYTATAAALSGAFVG